MTRRHGHDRQRGQVLRKGIGPHGKQQPCSRCEVWGLKFYVAVHLVPCLAGLIVEPELMEAVVEHVAVNWCRVGEGGGHPEGFEGFWEDYMDSVGLDVDPRAEDEEAELGRVWTNHALVLRREFDKVRRRDAAGGGWCGDT